MHLGLGLYAGLGLNGAEPDRDHLRFARQAGATHIVAMLQNGEHGWSPTLARSDAWEGGIFSKPRPERWTADALSHMREVIESEGLTLEALENFEPADWYDILLDGPLRDEQVETLQGHIRAMGAAGIPVMSYNFTVAGVWGLNMEPVARGGAYSTHYDHPVETPIPRGMVWNETYDQHLVDTSPPEGVGELSSTELWDRYTRFLKDIVPVAEEAGVKLALHPDDPPVPTLRGQARLVHRPEIYDRVVDTVPSESNCIDFCIGSLVEVPDSDIYASIQHFGERGKIALAEVRNVRGTVPDYREVFVDEGDTDISRVLSILSKSFDGVIFPDHTPVITSPSPWHAGMAYTLGWLRGTMQSLDILS